MNNIELYDCIDCLLVGFNVDKTLSVLQVISEAYYQSTGGELRRKGLIKLVCSNILQLRLEKNAEFNFDIQLPYNENGNDVRANEIYSIQCDELANARLGITLKSDFLNFDLICRQVEIVEIENSSFDRDAL